MKTAHPAVYSSALLPVFKDILMPHLWGADILDPFAGTGGIHYLRQWGYKTWGIELEPEWASQNVYTLQGDATALPFRDDSFHAIVTSPCYGNRMADHHEARDGSYRRTYTHTLGRKLHDNNAGKMQWSVEYRHLHIKAWEEAVRVLRPGGMFLLNIKDHQRDFKRVHVSAWHHAVLSGLGLRLFDVKRVDTPGFRRGENHQYRYPERVLVYSF